MKKAFVIVMIFITSLIVASPREALKADFVRINNLIFFFFYFDMLEYCGGFIFMTELLSC